MDSPFLRPVAVALLLMLGCAFAGNHIAARVAFDHGTGLLVAILCRSGAAALALCGLVLWQREPVRRGPGAGRACWAC